MGSNVTTVITREYNTDINTTTEITKQKENQTTTTTTIDATAYDQVQALANEMEANKDSSAGLTTDRCSR